MKRIYKDKFDKKLFGVCGGCAQYLQLDSSIIRLSCVLLAMVTGGVFVVFYFVLAAILPTGPKFYVEATYKRLYRSRTDRKIVGICGGLGSFLKIDTNILRFVFLVLLFVGLLPISMFYFIGALIIPEEPIPM